jgi:purine catabolism regulator
MQPTVADVLALDPVRRGSPRVLAAADRLDTPVRWVHVVELADPREFLRGGEFVLSTGIALPADPAGLDRFVSALADAGAAALAVEIGSRYVRELPRPLVQSATAHRLPLIVLERQTQFIAVTEAVHAEILAAQVAELRAAQRLHQIFTDLAAAAASADDIVARASALAGVPVILADLGHRVLACAPGQEQAADLLAGFAGRSRAVVVTGRSGYDPATGWLVAMVGGHGADWGRLIFALPAAPGPSDHVLAEQAATTLALARLVRDQRETPLRQAQSALLAALTGARYADPVDLHARISALGIPLAARRLLPVVIGPAGRVAASAPVLANMLDAVTSGCQSMAVPVLAGTVADGRIGALLALPAEADEDETLTEIAARLRACGQPGQPVIGVGPAVTSVAQASASFLAAAQAVDAADLADPSGHRPVVRLADLGLAGLLGQLADDPRVQAFAERQIGPLLLHDDRSGTDLAGLLTAYLRSGGNKAETAQRVRLARPTLYERLRQIEQILGASLDAAEVRLSLHAALIVHQAANNLSPAL